MFFRCCAFWVIEDEKFREVLITVIIGNGIVQRTKIFQASLLLVCMNSMLYSYYDIFMDLDYSRENALSLQRLLPVTQNLYNRLYRAKIRASK